MKKELNIVTIALVISIVSLALSLKDNTNPELTTVLDVCLMINPEYLSLYGVELCGGSIPELESPKTSINKPDPFDDESLV